MDTAALEELRALRARAYGPNADIDQDPVALRRLRELEAQGSGSTTRSHVDAAPPATSTLAATEAVRQSAHRPSPPTAARDASPEGDAGDAGATRMADEVQAGAAPAGMDGGAGATGRAVAAEPRESDPAPESPPVAGEAAGSPASVGRIPRRFSVLWVLSVIGAASLASGITFWATSMAPVSVSSGAPQIATLEPVPGVEIPAGWFGAGPSSRVWEFYGLTLLETTQGFTASGTDCFLVVPTEQLPAADADPNNWSMSGAMYSGCRLGDFPATAQVPVNSGMPESLRDRFPPDSALQFVLDGDRIGVFLDSD